MENIIKTKEINEVYLNNNDKISIFFLIKVFPKYKVDITPLNNKLIFSDAVKQFKSTNEFLFKATHEEKELTKKIQFLTFDS